MNDFNTKQRFSIRKYHIGAASVLLGAFIGLNTTSAQAAEEKVAQPVTESNITVAQPAPTTVAATPVEAQPATATSAVPGATAESTVPPVVAESTVAESVTTPVEYKSDAKITVNEEFKNALLERERIMRDVPAGQDAYLQSGSEIESNPAHKANHETLKRLGQELSTTNTYKNTTDIRPVNLTEIDSVHREEINLFAVDLINQLRAGIGNQEKLVPAKGMFDFAKDVVRNTKFETPGAKHQYSIINESAKNAGLSYVEDPVESKNSQRQQDLVYFKPRTEFSLPLKEELKNRLKALPNEWSDDNINAVKFNYGIDLDNGKIDQYDWSDMIIHSSNYVPSTTAQKNEDAQKLLADIWQEQSIIPMGKLKEYVYEGIKKFAFTSGEDYFTNSKRYWELALSTFGEFYAENNKYAAVTWSLRGSNTNLGEVEKDNPYSGRRAVLQNLFIHNSYTAPRDSSEYELKENQESKKDAIKYSVNKILGDNFDRTPITLNDKVESIYKDNGDGGLNAFIKTTKADGTTTEVADAPNNKVKSTVKVDPVAKAVRYEADTASQSPAGTETSRVSGKDGYTEKTTTWSLDAQGQPKENVLDTKVAMVEEVVKVSTKAKVETKEVPFQTVYEEDANLEVGTEVVKVEGKAGSETTTTTYSLDAATGKVTANVPTTSTVPAVNKVIVKGTKPKTEPTPPSNNNGGETRKGEGQYVNLPTLDPALLVPQPPVQGPGNGVTPPSNNNGGETRKGEGQYVNLPTLDPALLVPQPPVQGPGNGVTPPSNNNGGETRKGEGQYIDLPTLDPGLLIPQPPVQGPGNNPGVNKPGQQLKNTGIVPPISLHGTQTRTKQNVRVKTSASANVLPKTSSTTTNSATLPAGLVAALASAGLLAAKRRKED